MADPGRKYDYDPPRAPQDPFNPLPPERSDPLGPEPLMTDLSRREDETVIVDTRPSGLGAGNGLLIAAVVVILAAVAFYIFGPGGSDTTPTAEVPAPAATDSTTTSSTTANPPADAGAAGDTAAPADPNAEPAPKPLEQPAPAPAAPAQ